MSSVNSSCCLVNSWGGVTGFTSAGVGGGGLCSWLLKWWRCWLECGFVPASNHEMGNCRFLNIQTEAKILTTGGVKSGNKQIQPWVMPAIFEKINCVLGRVIYFLLKVQSRLLSPVFHFVKLLFLQKECKIMRNMSTGWFSTCKSCVWFSYFKKILAQVKPSFHLISISKSANQFFHSKLV